MADGEYWSIGEVLSLLQDEFPEITISKIRFLESQGLIQPERTPSGYRRFYQGDFDLLQWILVQQRDHYLPLKVIRDRIQAGDTEQGLLDFSGSNGDHLPSTSTEPTRPAPSEKNEHTQSPSAAEPSSNTTDVKPTAPNPTDVKPTAPNPTDVKPTAPNPTEPDSLEPDSLEGEQPAAIAEVPSSDTGVGEEAAASAGSAPSSPPPPARTVEPVQVEAEPLPPLALTRDELAESSGCSVKIVTDLERYGLVKGRKAGPTVLYDNTALLIARIAAQFGTFGLEPRHLRTFLIGAEREMGLVHQVVEPMLHRRDEETRRKAHETLDDLTDLAGSLRSILMRQAAEELLPKH